MRYKCIPCGDEFESDSSGKPRCPKCLGIHDIEKVSHGVPTSKKKRSPLTAIIVLIVAAAVVIIYVSVRKSGENLAEDEVGLEQAAKSALGKSDLPGGDGALPFAVTGKITQFAKRAADGEDGEDALEKFQDAIAKKKGEGFFKPHHQREPRTGDVLTADELLGRLETKQEPVVEALSYELAALMLAMAKSIGEDAEMVEINHYVGTKRPADPGGKLGRFGVKLKGDGAKVYDPWAGIVAESKDVDIIAMTDKSAMAPFYGLKSFALLIRQESADAMKFNEVGIDLDPKNPYLRATRGFIFAATGVPNEAIAEFEKAAKLRDNAVFRTNLAEMFLLTDPTGKLAESEIQLAIKDMPNFARAHALLAMILLMQRQVDQAEQELALAESLDPGSPSVAMFYAQYHLTQGDSEGAIEKAEQAVRLSGENLTTMLGLAQIYRSTARFDEMRATLDKVLRATDSAAVADQIKSLFEYDPSQDDVTAPSPTGSGLELKLGQGNPAGGSLKLGGGLNKGLKLDNSLGGGDLNLKLDLNKKE